MIAGLMVRKYVGKVETFLVAGREMDVYLGIASLAATEFGIVTCMYTAQNGYEKGFAGATPGILMALAMAGVGLTGFVIKPLRDSGVITIPELLEQKFGQRIRWAAGVVIVLGGLLNMGVFLRTGGQFLVLVAGLNVRYLEIMMTALLIGVAVYTILGGMLSVLVTDFLQFVVMSVGLILVTILILMNVGWEKLVTTVETSYGAGGFNPFVNPTMGWQYVLFNLMLNTAAVLTWQTIIARVPGSKGYTHGPQGLHWNCFLFCLSFSDPRHLGYRGTRDTWSSRKHTRSDADLPQHRCSSGTHGNSDRCDARGRYVDRLVVHVDVVQRDLQRHSRAVSQETMVGTQGSVLESNHHCSESEFSFCYTACGIRLRAIFGPISA
jgi:SSS family solute:Na+ symporter